MNVTTLLLLKSPTPLPPHQRQGGIRCGACGETLTICQYGGAHPQEPTPTPGGYVPGAYSSHDGLCQRPTGGACDCKTRDPYAI